MSPVVIFGAGGHGKVVADILLAMGRHVLGFVDAQKAAGSSVLGLPVLGGDDWLVDTAIDVALGVGDNLRRGQIADSLRTRGFKLASAIHPRAVVANSARISEGVVVAALAVVNADAAVAWGAIINTAAVVEHDCEVGAFAHLATNVTTGGGCHVGTSALVGSGATLLPQRRVGARSIVGSHSVVTRDVPDDCVAVGAPARVVRRR